MTAYGRASLERGGVRLTVELNSVNRKHLDINLTLPRHFARWDPLVRKMITAKVQRGHLTLRMSVAFQGEAPLRVVPNLSLIDQLFEGWCAIGRRLGVQEKPSLEILKGEEDLFTFEENPAQMEALGTVIEEAVDLALASFMEMKQAEGAHLEHEVRERIKGLRAPLLEIRNLAEGSQEKYRLKTLEKIRVHLPEIAQDDGRLLKEVALFADRIDISEELVRFDSHLEQFLKLLDSGEDAAGKKAEFILQEMGREVNTIGSKADELQIKKLVILIKAELEKVREQIQNVE